MIPPIDPFWIHEAALTRHFLGADGPEGAVPLTFLDASGREIARAMGRPDEEADAALDAFVRSFARSRLLRALRYGDVAAPPLGMNVMGWFSYLVLSCHVASVSPVVARSDRFRERLQARLGLDGGVSELRGIATLWERARAWCEIRHGRGEPIRPIALPDPGNATQIGHSLRISFPGRSDLRRMERLFGTLAIGGVPEADRVVRAVRAEIADRAWSQGFLRAFDDFSGRWRARDRLLEDHPFWVAIRGLVGGPDPRRGHTFDLEFHTGFDGIAAYSIRTDDPAALRALSIEGPGVGEPQSIDVELSQALSLFDGAAPTPPEALRRCHAEGAIPFSEVAWGVWRAERTPGGANVRLLLRADVARRAGSTPDVIQAWNLAPPRPRDEMDRFLAGIRGRGPERSGIAGVRVSGGVRMGEAFLGRPRFLPRVRAVAGCGASIEPVGTVVGAISLDVVGDVVALDCATPLDGVWRLGVTERGVVRARPSLVFEPEARLDVRRSADELAPDWRPEEPDPLDCAPAEVPQADADRVGGEIDPALADLLEVLHAGGATGWAEREIVGAISLCLADRFAGWDVLRLLADSGWIEARVSKRWRARRWYLVPPCLTAFPATGTVVLDGAAPAKLRRKFFEAAARAGIPVETRATEADWSIPSLLARTSDAGALAAAIGVPTGDAVANLPSGDAALRYPDTFYLDDHRIVGSTWDWAKGRFAARAGVDLAGVSIERLETARPSASDIYRVAEGGQTIQLLDGRCAATILGHRSAGVPLFRYDGRGRALHRVAGEGALPAVVARYLRLRAGCGPGLLFGAGGRGYVVPCRGSDASRLKVWLGRALDGGEDAPGGDGVMLRAIGLGRSRGAAGARRSIGLAAGARRC